MGIRRTARLLTVSMLLLCTLSTGCGHDGRRAATTAPSEEAATTTAPGAPPVGQLAFELTEGLGQQSNGRGMIWVVNTDGTGLRQLAKGKWTDRLEHPDWSPDGKRIVFHSGAYHPGLGWYDTHSVWTMNSDGTKQTQLRRPPVGWLWPAWSPDGTRIALSAYLMREGEAHIAVMMADGSRVTTLTAGRTLDCFPEWAPDGRIVFLRKPYLQTRKPGDLYVMNADGAGLTRLTRSGNVGSFKLSPDGSKIAFHDTLTSQIKLMPADGLTPATVLIDDDFGWRFAAITWAPDGRALAIGGNSVEAGSGGMIHTVNADGSNVATVPNVESGLDPAWRPK